MLSKIKSIFLKGHKRTVLAKKNAAISFILKSISIIIKLILVPLLLNLLKPTGYGLWITITAVISWFAFFDIGLGNGLRNKLAECLANNKSEEAKVYVSTSYFLLILIVSILLIIYFSLLPLINLQLLFNIHVNQYSDLKIAVSSIFVFFCIRFVFNLIGIILLANQRSAQSDLLLVVNDILFLLSVLILSILGIGSISILSIIYGAISIFVYLFANIYYFQKKYKKYSPSYKYIRWSYAKDLFSLGGKFFIMGASSIIIFSTDSMIITQLFGPSEVAPYDISYKYFMIVVMFFSIITTPFWSAFTEAFTIKDYDWMKNAINKLIKIWLGIVIIVLIMVVFSNYLYRLWIGNDLVIPVMLSILMGAFAIIKTFSSIFASFLNGIGKIKLSFYTSILSGILNIPLSIFFAKTLNMGLSGVILATCICLSYGVIIKPLQTIKIIKGSASGIWNK